MKKSSYAFLAFAAALLAPTVCDADGVRFFVIPSEGRPESGVGNSWKNGDRIYTSVAEAVAAAGTKDTVVLAPGTHILTESLSVNLRMTICNGSWENDWLAVPSSDVVLKGNGTFPLMMLNAQYITVKGLSLVNGYTNDAAGASCVMAKASGSANGFDISNCVFRDNNSAGACIRSKANGWWKIRDCVFTNNVRTATTSTIYGGVVDVELTSAPLNDSAFGQIKNCTFKDNTVDVNRYYGAVVSARLGGVNMDSCSFVSNTVSRTGTSSSKGGALYMGGNGAKVSNCTFVGETPDNAGYDMYGTVASAYDGNCVFSNCTFSAIEEKSSAKSKYGTVHVGGDGVKFVDCRFTGNTLYATSLLFLENKGDMLVRNCLFAKNERKNKNGRLLYRHGTAVTSSTAMTVENCTFADNTDTIAPCYFANADYTSYFINSVFTTESMLSGVTTSSLLVSNCCVTAFQEIGGLTYNDKCITKAAGECGFVDPEHGDYHLEMRSPLREKGVKLDWMTADATDLDGNPRVVSRFAEPLSKCASAMPDIGCYECMIRVPAFIVIVR